jgi:hypothetical protein
MVDYGEQLRTQLEWHWDAQLRPRLQGLTDEEYRWEPVAGCWSVRPRDQATSTDAVGVGDTVLDYALPEPTPPPVTTIAWRLGHIAVGLFGMRASNHFGDGSVTYATVDWPLTADGALAMLDEHYRRWTDGVRSLGTDDLAAPCGPAEGTFSDQPFAALILHINREAIHHGAEVALLRDLYRASYTT